jgi:hypothetical protein
VEATLSGVRNSTKWSDFPGAIEDGMSRMDRGTGVLAVVQFSPELHPRNTL